MEDYLERIRSEGFEQVESYKIIRSGWSNVVVEINDQWIFRFARDKKNTQCAVERDFLTKFEKISPVTIPSIVKSGEDYIAYRKIAGERFAPEKYATFSASQKAQLKKDLGAFLTELHNFRFAHPQLSEFPYGGHDFWKDLWPVVKDRLSDKTKKQAEGYFTNVLHKIEDASFEKVVTHSDLGTNNILVDFERHQLGGIIDFSDLSVADPAVDFASFYRHFGRQFVENVLDSYQRPIGSHFGTRIDYESKRKPFFVVYFALNNGFERHIPGIVSYIEDLFQDTSYGNSS